MRKWIFLLLAMLPAVAAAEAIIPDGAVSPVVLSDGSRLDLTFLAGAAGNYRILAAMERNKLLQWDLTPVLQRPNPSPAPIPNTDPPLKPAKQPLDRPQRGVPIVLCADTRPSPFRYVPPANGPTPAPLPEEKATRIFTIVKPVAKLTGPTTVAAGGIAFFSTVGSTGCGWEWKIYPVEMQSRLIPLLTAGSPPQPVAIYQPAASDTGIVYLAFVEYGDSNSCDIAFLPLTIGGSAPNPQPNPSPTPGPTPTPGKRWVILIEESQQRTPALMRLILDKNFRDYLDQHGHHWVLLDKDFVPAEYAPYLKKASKLPCLFIVDDEGHTFYEGDPPTADKAIELLKSKGG